MATLGQSFTKRLGSDLKCPGCENYLVPPILQCVNGHCFCKTCREKNYRCSICLECFTNVRCRALETLAQHCHVVCPNNCGEKFRVSNKKEHEENCVKRRYECKLGNCPWTGLPSELMGHVTLKHPGHSFVLGNGQFSTKWSGNFIKLATQSNELFWYYLLQDNAIPKFFRAFQYIGPAAKARNFEYTFHFDFPDNLNTISFSREVFSLQDDVIEEYNNDLDFHNTIQYVIKRFKNAEKVPCCSTIRRVERKT